MTTSNLFGFANHEVYAVSVRFGSTDNAMIATWVMPATLANCQSRLMLAASVSNYTTGLVERAGSFALQLLSTDQVGLVPLLGLKSGREQDKLSAIGPLGRSSHGAPLLPGTCGWAACELRGRLNGGDRIIWVADIVEQELVAGRRPLRVSDLFEQLPDDAQAALREKRAHDAKRDAELIRPVSVAGG